MRGIDELTLHLLELLAPLCPVVARPMFGGVGLFNGGTMFGLIAREELFLKVGDANRQAFEAAGEAPFSYGTRHGMRTIQSYWRCPPDLLDEPETLQMWVREAIEVARIRAKVPRKRA